MEDSNLSISDGVKLYENGVILAKECYEELNNIKGKINIIKQDLDKYKEENFELPKFTTVLAMNQKGSALLRKAKKVSRIPIITKPADYKAIPEIKAQFELNLRADTLFALCCEEMRSANWSLMQTPFVKK